MSVPDKPRIAVTGPERGGLSAWAMTALAVRRAGGRPVRITPATGCDEAELDGFIIGGGTDVDPLHYGEEPLPETNNAGDSSLLDWTVGLLLSALRALFARHDREAQAFDPERDAMEQHLIRHALYHNRPLLGICRGAQLLNVTLGGSLHQNIDHFYQEGTANPRSILPRKTVSLEKNSRLQAIMQSHTLRVNALHEQSIAELGEGLVISAQETNGVIQAIELDAQTQVIGVQWHPEYLPQSRHQQRLFRSLVNAATQDS